MTDKNQNISDGLNVVAAFLQSESGRLIAPQNTERTIQAIIRWLRAGGFELNLPNMQKAWSAIQQTISAIRPASSDANADTPESIAETESLVAQINSWSADTMKRNMASDPSVAAAVENVLTEKARIDKAKAANKRVEAKAQVKKPTVPVRTPEEKAALNLTSAEIKRITSQGGDRARGLERIFAGIAAKERQEAAARQAQMQKEYEALAAEARSRRR